MSKHALDQLRREIDGLETRLQRMVDIAADQQRVLELCPGGFPDGTGIFGAEGWIKWAKKRLGYVDSRGE